MDSVEVLGSSFGGRRLQPLADGNPGPFGARSNRLSDVRARLSFRLPIAERRRCWRRAAIARA